MSEDKCFNHFMSRQSAGKNGGICKSKALKHPIEGVIEAMKV
jgi:hypothetical protein